MQNLLAKYFITNLSGSSQSRLVILNSDFSLSFNQPPIVSLTRCFVVTFNILDSLYCFRA